MYMHHQGHSTAALEITLFPIAAVQITVEREREREGERERERERER
jgi:hypothetical protein